MPANERPLPTLTAGDVMTRNVLKIPEDAPLRSAASLLLQNQISGAPVVNAAGQCIGVFSTVDLLRAALRRPDIVVQEPRGAEAALPRSCPFVVKQLAPSGAEVALCTLPPGVCPVQMVQPTSQGDLAIVCRLPNCVFTDWQIVELEQLSLEKVRGFMTADPVMVPATARIQAVARLMIDAHLHRVIVVDEANKPIGVVSSTDVLAAVAYANGQ